jgi:hypothetical protein
MFVRRLSQILSAGAFIGTIAPALLYIQGSLTLPQTKSAMLIATITWFVVTPLWMDREASPDQQPAP